MNSISEATSTYSTSVVAEAPSSSRQPTASPRGRATGVDIWRLRDQTGNSQASAEGNAMVEGVSERVDFVDADARHLPFPPESFDVVLSNLTFDNIRDSEERAKALREAVRVLRSGGRMRVVDDRADRYAPILQSAGCVDV